MLRNLVRRALVSRAALIAAVCIGTIAPAAAQMVPVRIAFPSGMNGQVVVIMEKAGIAQKVGMKAEYSSFQYGPPMMEALAAGSIDAVVTSLMPVTSYASKLPGDVKIVSLIGNSSHSLMVAKDSLTQNPDELAGKTIGVSYGSDSHLDTLSWLKSSGLSEKVLLTNIDPGELVTALSNKSVDAIVIRQPQVQRLQQQSGARILHTWPFHFVSIMKSKFIAEHPAEARKFIEALRQSVFFISQNQDQAAIWFGAYLKMSPQLVKDASKIDPNYNVSDINQIDLSVTPASREFIKNWVDRAFKEKIIKQKVDLSLLVP